MNDCLIIGGGVIGLSLAYELACQGMRVRVIDRGEPGQESSWAGAGILPPASLRSADPVERLTALSNQLHAEWAQRLREETGIDTGYRRSGCLYLARKATVARELLDIVAQWRDRHIAVEAVTPQALAELEPNILPDEPLQVAFRVPDEVQIRNPRHLKALLVACARLRVEVSAGVTAEDFDVRDGRLRGVKTSAGTLEADHYCITSGAWSGSLLARLGPPPLVKPMRGQIVLLRAPRPVFTHIVYEGPLYLVPRPDGRVLIGSTVEDVGFDRSTTAEAIAKLLSFANSLLPPLRSAHVERCWAGLRPGSCDGLPYLGRVPGLTNAFVAAGHFRSGLQLSTGTALVMSQLILGHEVQVDLTPFRPDRAATSRTEIAVDRPMSYR